MKKLLLALFCIASVQTNFAQQKHHFYIGVNQGVGYSRLFEKDIWYGSSVYPPRPSGTYESVYKKDGVASLTRLELLYGFKRFRVGYQLDYFFYRFYRHKDPPYKWNPHVWEPYQPDYFSTGNFVGNSLIFEILVFEKKRFSIWPTIYIGHLIQISNRRIYSPGHTTATWRANNYFQAGASINFGYKVGVALLYFTPNFVTRYTNINLRRSSTDKHFYILYSVAFSIGARIDLLPFIVPRQANK